MPSLVFGRDRLCRHCAGRGYVVREGARVRPAYPCEINPTPTRHGVKAVHPCADCGGAGLIMGAGLIHAD